MGKPSLAHVGEPASPGRARWLTLEWIVLYGIVPFVAYVKAVPVHKFLLFLAPLLYTLLLYGAGTRQPAAARRPFAWHWLLLRLMLSTGGLLLAVLVLNPQQLFNLPGRQPGLWALILLLYPFISALPQEFAYRTFYFWRYAALFPQPRIMVASNALAFSFLHLMYDNWVAVVLSLIGGVYFALTYQQSGRLIFPWLEHSLYGQIIFTIGLGQYFYEPLH